MDKAHHVIRDPAWIDREYGSEKWPAIEERIAAEQRNGETCLARIVAKVKRQEIALDRGGEQTVAVDGKMHTVPRPFALGGGRALLTQKMLSLCDGVAAIIELGSGWGYNLCHLWLEGGPRGVPYFALEYTEAGQRCAAALSRLAPGPHLVSLPFDYYRVDLASLGRFDGPILVFTLFSVDQIPQLPADIFPALAALAPRVDCLHFEPAGWQMTDDKCVGSSRAYAEKHDYNRNLWPLLQEQQRRGLLTIQDSHPNYFGQNPENGAAMIHWRAEQS